MIESQDKDPDEIIKSVIEKTSFLSQFEDNTEENLDKKMNVSELVNSAKEFSKLNKDATLTDYLGSITLSSDTDELNEGNFVTIATVHAVKGLEFDSAFIVGLDETIFPISRACDSDEELEEERRLMYVAITRAKTNLYLTRAKSRYLYGNRSVTAESRFVKEIKPLVYEKGGSYYEPKPQQPTQSYVDRHKRNNGADDYGYYPDEPSSGSSYSKSFSSRVITVLKLSIIVAISCSNLTSCFGSATI